MAVLTVSTDDLALFMGSPVDDDRAQLILDLAIAACSAYLTPLPDTAKAVVLSVAAGAYASPVTTAAQSIGPYSVGQTSAGVTLSRQQRRDLRRLAGAGGGGAFSVNPTPIDAGQGLPPWAQNVTYLDGIPGVETQTFR